MGYSPWGCKELDTTNTLIFLALVQVNLYPSVSKTSFYYDLELDMGKVLGWF